MTICPGWLYLLIALISIPQFCCQALVTLSSIAMAHTKAINSRAMAVATNCLVLPLVVVYALLH